MKVWIEVASARVSAATGRFAALRGPLQTSLVEEETTTVANDKLGEPT